MLRLCYACVTLVLRLCYACVTLVLRQALNARSVCYFCVTIFTDMSGFPDVSYYYYHLKLHTFCSLSNMKTRQMTKESKNKPKTGKSKYMQGITGDKKI